MTERSFVHLHTHTQYSLLESSIRIPKLCEKAQEFGMMALAQTDLGNMFGAIDFYQTAQKKGLKPILGADVYFSSGSRFEKGQPLENVKAFTFQEKIDADYGISRFTLLCKSLEGYRNLCKILSKGYLEGLFHRPRVDWDVLKDHSEGLIALSGSILGEAGCFIRESNQEKASQYLLSMHEIFKENFYLELQRQQLEGQEKLNQFFINFGKKQGISLVATNECYYLEKEASESQEILRGILLGQNILDENRIRFPTSELYFKSAEEMRELFSDYPEACDNTLHIAEQCSVELNWTDEKGHQIYHLPHFPIKTGESTNEYFKRLSFEGLEERFQGPHFIKIRAQDNWEKELKFQYYERLELELEMIMKMGFAGYFLIVSDFIIWAKDNGIPVGPGRGSGAGSLIAYSLQITNINPLPYNLLFERFINPERVSMPDFDVDFCQERRGEVIEYVTQKYGKDKVGQIITFGKLLARAVIRDVSRVFALPYVEADALAKLVPEELGITLKKALEKEPKLRDLQERDPKIRQVLKVALDLEGLARHASIHAAGVIITNEPLVHYCPLFAGREGEQVVQFDKDFSEMIGLVKFDFLGLKTLTVIDRAVRLIQRDLEPDFDIESIDLEDKKVYDFISTGKTTGVFQLESSGMKDLCKRIAPDTLEDITAINALYRPGPLESGMVDDFIEIKHGRKDSSYLFPELEVILKDTYGIVLYQEQVMNIARTIAGYSLGQADILRRAMGKKKAEVMREHKKIFLAGAAEKNFDQKKAEELFDLIALFAAYGFNKSHAVVYALIAYQTAFLKLYYPAAFFAALLSTEMRNTDKVGQYISDAIDTGLTLNPPDINESLWFFDVNEGDIRFGMGAIKNVGEGSVQAVVNERKKNGKYQSFLNFCERVSLRQINRRMVESLIKVGAFDLIEKRNRKTLLENLDAILAYASKQQQERQSGQINLFMGNQEVQRSSLQIMEYEDFEEQEKLNFEMELMGMYVSGHPLDPYKEIATKLQTHSLANLQQIKGKDKRKEITVVGLLTSKKNIISKKGDSMAFATLEDLSGKCECIIFPKVFQEYEYLLNTGEMLVITGSTNLEEEPRKVFPQKIELLNEKLMERIRAIKIHLRHQDIQGNSIERLKKLLEDFPGPTQVTLMLETEEGKALLSLKEKFRVEPTTRLLSRINQNFTKKTAQFLIS